MKGGWCALVVAPQHSPQDLAAELFDLLWGLVVASAVCGVDDDVAMCAQEILAADGCPCVRCWPMGSEATEREAAVLG